MSCAHSVWLTDGDIELLADAGTTVCHNPSSNLRLKNGIAPVNAMLAGGVNVAMGTDSTAINDDDDMLQEMRLASKLHRQPGLKRPAMDSHQALRLTTANAARPTGFDGRIGALGPGRYADMVLLDWDAMTAPYFEGSGDPAADAVNAVVYRGKSAHVDTVLINGQVVLREGRSVIADEEAVTAELREQLARPLESETVATRQMGRAAVALHRAVLRRLDHTSRRPALPVQRPGVIHSRQSGNRRYGSIVAADNRRI